MGALLAAASAAAAAWSAMRRRVAVSVIAGSVAAACWRSNSATGWVRAVKTLLLRVPASMPTAMNRHSGSRQPGRGSTSTAPAATVASMARCATDGGCLHAGLGALLESFIGGLAAQAAVGPVVVVEVLPLAQLVVEDLGVVDHHPVQQLVELLSIDAMRALDLAVQPRRPRLDVVVADALVQDVPVEAGAELDAVVSLDDLDSEGQAFQHIIDELDGRLLVELGVDAQYPQPGAVGVAPGPWTPERLRAWSSRWEFMCHVPDPLIRRSSGLRRSGCSVPPGSLPSRWLTIWACRASRWPTGPARPTWMLACATMA